MENSPCTKRAPKSARTSYDSSDQSPSQALLPVSALSFTADGPPPEAITPTPSGSLFRKVLPSSYAFIIRASCPQNASASLFLSRIFTSVLSAVERLLVSSLTLHVPSSISNRFCSVLILEIFLMPIVCFLRFTVLRSITIAFSCMEIRVFAHTNRFLPMMNASTSRHTSAPIITPPSFRKSKLASFSLSTFCARALTAMISRI